MTTPLPPCRLYGILARDASVGVIFRRGPSRRVQLIRWDTLTDTFTPGQWFHGRIYEQQARLSADGTLLMYDAMKINRRTRQDKDYGYSWTAISKPPYLTALTLWASGTSSGRMRSTDVNPEWNRHWEQANAPHPADNSARKEWQQIQEWEGEFIESAWSKAYREGRQAGLLTGIDLLRTLTGLKLDDHYVTYAPGIDEKMSPDRKQTLTKTTIRSGFKDITRYSIRDNTGEEDSLAGVEWADWDHQGRLVYARAGRIFAPAANAIGQDPPRELIDLNSSTPELIVAPDWAKHW